MMKDVQELLECKFTIRNLFPRRIMNRHSFVQKSVTMIFYLVFSIFYLYVLFSRKAIENILIYLGIGLIIFIIINLQPLTLILKLNDKSIQYKGIFSSKLVDLELKDVKHFCFYETPVERFGYSNKLVVYLKPLKFAQERVVTIRLNFSAEENMMFLSNLYRLGFKVLLFDLLLNIEESEFYIP